MYFKIAFISHGFMPSCVLAFLVTAGFICLLTPLAMRLGLTDHPGGRKQHCGVVPLIGGMGMFAGLSFALLTLNISLLSFRSYLAGSAILVLVGVLDDFRELSTRLRFVAQIFVALMMTIIGTNVLHTFGNLLYLGSISLGYLAIPVTVFAVVSVINAVNMSDGVDGLVGLMSLQQFSFLTVLALQIGDDKSALLLGLIICTIVAYLLFNLRLLGRKVRQVFMGDCGSMFLGFSLAWFLVSLSQGIHPAARPVTMLWIIAIPLFDTTRLLIKRTIKNGSPLAADRDHVHHLLQAAGYSHMQIALSLTGVSLLLGTIGILGGAFDVVEGTMFSGFIALFICYCFGCGWLRRCGRKSENHGELPEC